MPRISTPQPSARHPKIQSGPVWIIISLALCLLLNGCAVSFVYRHADWLMLHKLDQYFDLTADQRKDMTGRIQAILLKHRREALPQYESFLVQVRQRVERGITGEDVEWFYASFDRLRDDLFERFVDDGGVFLASVGPAQKNTLARAMRKDNETAAKLASSSVRDRSKKQSDNTLEVVKDWTGFLTKDQRAKIVEWSQRLPDTQPMFFQYRQQRQQELLTLLERPRTPESAAQTLRAALVHQERTAPPWYLHAVQEWRDGIKDLVPKIDQTLSPSQRRYALDKLQRLIVQVRDLHG
ncbi:DUF6279 family lipoprotein [Nitrospira sp. Nam80]